MRKMIRFRFFIIAILILAAIFGVLILLGPHFFAAAGGAHHMKQWFVDHGVYFAIWRLSIIVGIFLVWPTFIRFKSRGKKWTAENIMMATNLRYWILLFMLLMDFILHL